MLKLFKVKIMNINYYIFDSFYIFNIKTLYSNYIIYK